MRIWTRKSASIQPRTSLRKSDVSWPALSSRARAGPRAPDPRRRPGLEKHIALLEARSRLDQRRFSRPNTHFSAFFDISVPAASLRHDTSLFPRLVLGWINADFRVQIRIFQHFSSSTRKSSSRKQICESLQNFTEFCKKL